MEKQPSKILLQVGTNNLSDIRETEEVLDGFGKTIAAIKTKFPEARIYVSALLPRRDKLHKTAMEINKCLDEGCDELKLVTFIQHRNTSRKDLYDNLHLHTGGFYKFVWNLKGSMFGLLPSSNDRW